MKHLFYKKCKKYSYNKRFKGKRQQKYIISLILTGNTKNTAHQNRGKLKHFAHVNEQTF